MKKLLDRIEELFLAKLQTKTGWGKNEVMEAYRAAKIQALTEALEENTQTPTP